ncbi:hypothetical protein Nepgr_002863 [Nepenthes gracilis]|uniref:Cellulose synthase n=1 Tax=Nepenthes gracilis TaxID=150966 RepID=A0AAD3RY29_NEPGR|nr:hypothetical protein Nepgr_002863 [Nepenthes gracilis]
MDSKGQLVAGSHNRNEFVLINADDIGRVTSVKELSRQICQICADEVEITVFKRIKGSPRVEGDEEEDDIDDIDNELDYASNGRDPRHIAEAMPLHGAWNIQCLWPHHASRARLICTCFRNPPLISYGLEFILFHFPILLFPCHLDQWMNPKKDLAVYGYGGVAWKDRMEEWKKIQNDKLKLSNMKVKMVGIMMNANLIMRTYPKTYLDRLSLRYEKEGQPSELASVDAFVSTVDPMKEPPFITANTFLSIRTMDYPVDKVSCYVSDDGAAMLTFEALSETSEFARKWVLFCKKFSKEPHAPEWYFSRKVDYLRDKANPSFVRERRAMMRDYEEFKVWINGLVAIAEKVPEEGWTMQDGTPWPGNNVRDHPGMIQVFLGQHGVRDVEGNQLPCLVYVSREKRPGFEHHKKAGAMNALIRVSAVLSNAPYLLNVDCDHYINNSKALREAMCFMMDPISGKKICYVQFPQRFDGIDRHDRYSN